MLCCDFVCFLAPGAVPGINVSVVDVNNVTVTWLPVRDGERNGILDTYIVSLWVYGGQQLQATSVLANATLQASFTELGMCVIVIPQKFQLHTLHVFQCLLTIIIYLL